MQRNNSRHVVTRREQHRSSWQGRSSLTSVPYPLHEVRVASRTIRVGEGASHEGDSISLFIRSACDPSVRFASKCLPCANQSAYTTYGDEAGFGWRTPVFDAWAERQSLGHNYTSKVKRK